MKSDCQDSRLMKLINFVLKFNKAFLSLAVILLISTGFYTYQRLESEIESMVQKELESSLIANAEVLNQWFEVKEQQITALVNDNNIQKQVRLLVESYKNEGADKTQVSEAFSTTQRRLRGYCKDTEFTGFFLVNYDYQCIATNDRAFLNYQLTEKDPCFSKIENLETTVFQLPTKKSDNKANAQILMFVATPILNKDKEPIAILGLTLDPQHNFSRVMSASRTGESGETYAFNENAWMISESRFTNQLKEMNILDEKSDSSVLNIKIETPEQQLTKMTASALTKSKEVTFPFIQSDIKGYPDYRGISVIGAWTYLDKYNFGLTSEIDYSEAMRSLMVVRIVNVIILTLASFFLLMLSFYAYVNSDINRRRKLAESEVKEMGQYRILGKIGEGGMGIIYKAEHMLMKRETALKVLKHSENLEDSRSTQHRFEKEVMLSSKLTHPNTIGIFDYGTTSKGQFYYAMELLDGLDIANLIKIIGPISPERTIYFLRQACASLNEAHQKQLIHRDIKPQNIMVCYRGAEYDVIKVLDFGLVKEISAEATQTMTISGSPIFMSPESIVNPSKVTELTDIYSFGVTAFYMLTGKYPFKSPEGSANALFQHISQKPLKPSEVVKFKIPEDLENLIMQCLEKEPENRPQSMNEISERLLNCQDALKWNKHKAEEWWLNNPNILKETQGKVKPITKDNFASTLKIQVSND